MRLLLNNEKIQNNKFCLSNFCVNAEILFNSKNVISISFIITQNNVIMEASS